MIIRALQVVVTELLRAMISEETTQNNLAGFQQ